MRSPMHGKAAVYWVVFLCMCLPVLPVFAQRTTNDWREAWFSALQSGDMKTVTRMLREGVNPRVSDRRGEGSLLVVATRGHLPVAEALLDAGIPVDNAGILGGTALMRAAANGHTNVVNLLIERGASVNQRDRRWFTALNYAVMGRHAAVVNLLLSEGGDPNNTGLDGVAPLLLAVGSDMATALILHRADVNVRHPQTDATPLINASACGDTNLVKALMSADADVNAFDAKGRTALFHASARGHHRVVELLLKHAAKVEVADIRRKTTPLMIAAQNGHSFVVQVLMTAGSKTDAQDCYGATALLYAQEHGHKRIVEMLAEAGARSELFVDGQPTLALARQTLNELGQLERACEQYSMAKGLHAEEAPRWPDVEEYVMKGTPLHARKGRDVIGNPFVIKSAGSVPSISRASVTEFSRVLDADGISPDEFWGKYLP